jgi:hypothetical protein
MNLTVAYRGRSEVRRGPAGLAVSLAPNLRRDRVSFAGVLRQPLRFREAVSALHDVVISDLRYKPRDRSAYQAYLEEQEKREAEIRRTVYRATKQELQQQQAQPLPAGLQQEFHRKRKRYWDARQQYANFLLRTDPELWRLLMPCDPVITVAPDVLFFECFSADESSYGCLTVERGAFSAERDVSLGTTNVDYSWRLYESFQQMRSYRETRFTIDPAGFEVQTHEAAGYREEKIDLPPSWLRGFMQLQAAMSLPMRRVPLSREGLYSVLAFLKRHRAAKSPRAVRFELEPGKPVTLVLEPWERRIVLHGTPYPGAKQETIRIWGRDRLRVLARLLPLLEGGEVYLLGTGLPSFWVVKMGEVRLALGLSGWTVNDWTGAAALDQIAPPGEPSAELLGDIAASFKRKPALTFEQVRQQSGAAPAFVAAGLNRLALLGQVIHDLPANLYRWRQVMPVALSLEQIGPDSPETVAARELSAAKAAKLTRDEQTASGLRLLAGQVPDQPPKWGWKATGRPVELVLDGDGRMLRGRCTCSHHYKGGLRMGPCRHLQTLRNAALGRIGQTNLEKWFERLWG